MTSPSNFMTAAEVADRWKIQPQTLSLWRMKNKGPNFTRIGGSIRYRREEIESYEQDNETG